MSAGEGHDAPRTLLVINSGSSSIRFSARLAGEVARELLAGKIDRIGLKNSGFAWRDLTNNTSGKESHQFARHEEAVGFLLHWIQARPGPLGVAGVGHRIVHGGPNYFEPMRVTAELITELKRITPYDPEHLRAQIALIEIFQKQQPALPQAACFDTAFHRQMPPVAKLFPIPRHYAAEGIHRYGFHGLSYAYMVQEVARLDGAAAARQRLVLAHLGNGASLCAARGGTSIDTTMSFTPAAGIPMSARS